MLHRILEHLPLQHYWHPDFGARVFWYDAFLSHNRGDESAILDAKLQASGVRTYYDGKRLSNSTLFMRRDQ